MAYCLSMSDFYSGGDSYNLDRIVSHHHKVLNKDEIELIREYINSRTGGRGISEVRARKIAYSLVAWKSYLHRTFLLLKIEDVYQGIANMKEGTIIGGVRKGKPLAPNTQRDMVIVLKPFLRWLIRKKNLKIALTDVYDREEGIKAPAGTPTQITSAMILTVDEIMNTIKFTRNRRDQAIVSVLYESGCRIGELGRLKWKDAVFEEHGIKLYIPDRKANQKRYYLLTMSRPALTALKDSLPDALPDSPIFIDDEGQPMKYKACEKILKTAAVRAGVTKKVHLHLLRHTRATHMKAQGFDDSTIKKALWNNENTEQWETYVNLSEADQDGEFLRMAGISKEDRKKIVADNLKPQICYKCGSDCLANAEFCWKCGNPLKPEAIAAHKNDEAEAVKLFNNADVLQKSITITPEDLQKMIADAIDKRMAVK